MAAIDGTLKTSSTVAAAFAISVATVSRSPAEDDDEDDDEEEEEDDDRLSLRIEVKRVEVLRLSCCFLAADGVVGVVFAGVELA